MGKMKSELQARGELESAMWVIKVTADSADDTISYGEAIAIIKRQIAIADAALCVVGGVDIPAVVTCPECNGDINCPIDDPDAEWCHDKGPA